MLGAVDSNYTITYVNGAVTESAAPTTTAITGITPNPSMVGQPVTVSYTVTVSAPGSGTIPGTDTVTVTDSTGGELQRDRSSGQLRAGAHGSGSGHDNRYLQRG